MLTLLDHAALDELKFQTESLNAALRKVLAEAEERVDGFEAWEPEDEFEADLLAEAQENLGEEIAFARLIVRDTLGVAAVLIHSHVEHGLKRIFKATREGNLNSTIRWADICRAYEDAGIEITRKGDYGVADSIRHLSNTFKHHGGKVDQEFLLPDGTVATEGTRIDYSIFDWNALAEKAASFLQEVGSDANAPYYPRSRPKVEIEVGDGRIHTLARIRSRFDGTDSNWQVKVDHLITDGSMGGWQEVGVIDADPLVVDRRTVAAGVVVLYRFKFLNSRGEEGPYSDLVRIVQR